MNNTLKEQLDDLAEHAVGDRTLDHPAFATGPTPPRQGISQAGFAVAACVAIVALFAGAWLLQRSPSGVDTAGRAASQPIPSLLLEEPTPLSDLSAELQEAFVNRDSRGPLFDLGIETATKTFDGVHVIERGDMTVVVGLDTTGSTLCVATQRAGADGLISSCGSLAGFMMESSRFIGQTFDGQSRTVALVPNDVVAIEIGLAKAEVTRNVGILEVPPNDVLRLVYADGRSEAAQSIPDPDARGQLVIDGLSPIDVAGVGCSIVDGRIHAEAAFIAKEALISVILTSDGVVLNGGIDDDNLDVIDTSAQIDTDVASGTLIISSTWATDDRSGTITIDCGDRLLDLSGIR